MALSDPTDPFSFDTLEATSDPAAFETLMTLRYAVFCDEQGVPREIERDDEDAFALHVRVRDATGRAVATGRVLRQRADGRLVGLNDQASPGDRARIGRMAVRADLRGTGLGARVLGRLEGLAKAAGLEAAVLHAQVRARGFYARAGYEPHGAEFDEAGIVHVEMVKRLV